MKEIRKKSKVLPNIIKANVRIEANRSNTLSVLSYFDGGQEKVINKKTGGSVGFRNTKKRFPKAATKMIFELLNKEKFPNLVKVDIYVKGFGKGRYPAIKAINDCGVSVLSINDVTPLPHGGCRKRRPRR